MQAGYARFDYPGYQPPAAERRAQGQGHARCGLAGNRRPKNDAVFRFAGNRLLRIKKHAASE
jgi:hypothetical protein